MKKALTLMLLFCGSIFIHAQTKKNQLSTSLEKDSVKVVDSLKITKISDNLEGGAPFKQVLKDSIFYDLKEYGYASEIDSLWQEKLMHSDFYAEMQEIVQNAPYEEVTISYLPTDTLKSRLAKLDAKTPFKIEYNPSLESVINRYLKRNKKTMERMMTLSEYYFPMFEDHLAKYNIPLEIKYLAIVESALNPRAKSWVGATGLWQFMFATGKMHNLNVSSYVDDRMDPLRSTEAACQYLSTLYDMFGDWDLALASYNAGPGNVARAIRRSGGNKNYWEIRRYLPRETAGYVPAFFATMYIFEYAKEHGFQPEMPKVMHFQTDTVHIKQLITFDHISEITGIDVKLLEFLNPSYKLDIVPHIEGKTFALRLPIKEAGLFVANENSIYNFVSEEIAAREKPLPRYYEAEDKIRYRVRPGDVLGTISEKYGVRVSDIKKWNHLRSSRIRIGQHLTIYPKKPVTTQVSSTEESKASTRQKTYVVQQGDSLWSISQKFPGITVQNIQNWNDISGTNLKPGMKLTLSKG
ncbi:MAG TPA: LysM peptidoglycan-binding domain-containing protein [Flavobacteriaceae bacterium]|nr:LysM peptidoglycan-binding domain-containing protein [Flavobacteriaceae bacterium]